jgi:predicted phage terminase large subunit-like protein
MTIKELAKRAESRDLTDIGALSDYFEVLRLLEKEEFESAHKMVKTVRRIAAEEAKKQESSRHLDLYYRSLLFDAPYDFDAHCIYIEKNRDPDKKFYLPRRKQLRIVSKALQRLADRELELLAISLPPGVGKTTLALFYITWLAGRSPEKPILTGSHSNAFLRGAYDECLRIMEENGDYVWNEVFPDKRVVRTNAQDMMIDVGKDRRNARRFSTLEFSSIGSGNAGKVRAENLLYCDDLISDLQQALSKERLDLLWAQYTTDLRQRKIGDAVELHIATRWSCHDVIGRLEQAYDGSEKAEFITVPALNENDESNFNYKISAGFTTEFYHKQREIMDDASWKALYMNEPIEREGLLYFPGELRRYFELPDREPDAIISVCDTKDRGTDYCVMPIAYQYGTDFYIESFVCDNSNPDVVEARLVDRLLRHSVHMSRFESNSAGGKIAEKVQSEVKKRGGRTKITTKYTTANKETRIIVSAGFAKDHFLFKDESVIGDDKEYRKALNFLCSYTMSGKNKNDDVPDAISMLVDYIESFELGKVQVYRRIF